MFMHKQPHKQPHVGMFFHDSTDKIILLLFDRLNIQGKNQREEPKGIVFLSKLLLLFQCCHLCFFPQPEVAVSLSGTMLKLRHSAQNVVKNTPGGASQTS